MVSVIILTIWVTFIVQGFAIQIYRNDYINKNTATFIMALIPTIIITYSTYVFFNKSHIPDIIKILILSLTSILSLFPILFYFDMLYPEWWPYIHF